MKRNFILGLIFGLIITAAGIAAYYQGTTSVIVNLRVGDGLTIEGNAYISGRAEVNELAADSVGARIIRLGNGATVDQILISAGTPTPIAARYYDDIFGLGLYQGLLFDAGLREGDSANFCLGTQADGDAISFVLTHSLDRWANFYLGYAPDLNGSLSETRMWLLKSQGEDLYFQRIKGGQPTSFLIFNLDGDTPVQADFFLPLRAAAETSPCDGATTKGAFFSNSQTGIPCYCDGDGAAKSIVDGTTCYEE
jgi:hypothetical protein